MTVDQLIARLSAYPGNMPVCVTTGAGETLEAGEVDFEQYSEDEGGPCVVITGLEDMEGVFGPATGKPSPFPEEPCAAAGESGHVYGHEYLREVGPDAHEHRWCPGGVR